MPKGRKKGGEEALVQSINDPIAFTEQIAVPVAAQAAETPSTLEAPVAPSIPSDENVNFIEVKSPMIGTFYRRSSPDKDPFKDVGDRIKEGEVVCVIEAMKLFNEIESEVSGKIVKFLVEDNTPVEYDQT